MFIQTTTKYRVQKLCPFTPAIIAIVYRWHECYSINKTSIRKNYSGVTEIVELKSK